MIECELVCGVWTGLGIIMSHTDRVDLTLILCHIHRVKIDRDKIIQCICTKNNGIMLITEN